MSRLLKESDAVERGGWLRAAVLGAEDGILSLLLPCLSRIGLLKLNEAVALATSKSSLRTHRNRQGVTMLSEDALISAGLPIFCQHAQDESYV